MSEGKLNRRQFLRGMVLAGAGAFLAACAQPTATPVPTKAPAATTAATKAPAVTAAPTKEGNPATVNSDRICIISSGRRIGTGIWGCVSGTHWRFETEFASFCQYPLMYGTLEASPGGQFQPMLAEKFVLSPDCKSIDISLQKKAKWSDGKQITTKDVVYTIKVLYDKDQKYWLGDAKTLLPGVVGGQEYFEGKAKEITGLKVIDDFTMKIEFTTGVCNPFMNMSFISILPEHHLSKYTVAQLFAGEFPEAYDAKVYSGPYKVSKWDKDAKYLEIERRDDWWGNEVYGKPGMKRLATQGGLGIAQLTDKKCDVLKPSATDKKVAETLSHIQIFKLGWMEYGMMINRDPKRGLSPKFIKAVNHAVNRKAFQDSQYLGDGDIVGSIFGTASKDTGKTICKTCDPAMIAPPAYDPNKAKALLAEDKWDANRVLVVAGTAAWLPLLKENLEAVGLKVEIRTGGEVTQDLMNKGEYDITDQGSGFIVNDLWNCQYWVGDPTVEIWLKWTKWVNEEFRKAARLAISSNDPAVVQPALKKCTEIYDQEGPIWGIGQIMSYFAVNKDIGGFVPETAFNFVGTCGKRGIESWYWKA